MGTNRWSISLGRVAGIRVRIHATFLLLLILVVVADGRSTRSALGAQLLWVVVFACVLVHELAHSVVATRLGIRVKDILLLPIGGVSEMDRLPDNPRQEAAVADAGPAASLLLAGAALLVSASLGQHWWPPAMFAGAPLARLGWLNALLAGFNLLPVLPMDGGRLLRASLETRLGRTQSTIVAARVGRIGAAVLIAAGIFYDLWLVFIGLFILMGAGLEQANAQAHEQLSLLPTRAAITDRPWTIEETFPLAGPDLDRALAHQGILPVTSGHRPVGVLGPDQRAAVWAGSSPGEAADRDVPIIQQEEPLDHVLDAMQLRHQPGVIVVGPGGDVVGIVSPEALRQVLARNAGPMR